MVRTIAYHAKSLTFVRFRLCMLVLAVSAACHAETRAQHSFAAGPGWQSTPPAEVFAEPLSAPVASSSPLQLDTPTMGYMLDFQNQQSEKQLAVLESQNDSGQFPRIIVGGQMRASMIAAKTNSANKFSYLGRFPPDFTGTTATDARITQANAAMMLHAAPGVSGYLETLFSDVFTFPTFNQGSFQMRQAYVVLGDLQQSPLYGFIGKKNVTFGDFRTLSPFSQAMPWHYFAPLAEGIGGGYSADGLDISAMAINGSRGIRVSDSPKKGHLNNFAINGSYTSRPDDETEITIGAGYLHGTIYNAGVAEHTDPSVTGPNNPAWDVNTRVRLGRYYATAEYVTTVNNWPVVAAPVQAYKTELGIDFPDLSVPTFLSASWSQGLQGDRGTPFRSNSQLVLGTQFRLHQNVDLSFEYIRSLGFAPLINITTVSDPNVIQNTFLVGLVFVL